MDPAEHLGGASEVFRGSLLHGGGKEGPLTYNFDAERWYENQRAVLEAKLQRGELDRRAFEEGLEDLERRLEAMEARLDGSFQIRPGKDRGGRP